MGGKTDWSESSYGAFSSTIDTNKETEQTHWLILPYRGKQGDRAIRNINTEKKS